jgi:hypothetical protein
MLVLDDTCEKCNEICNAIYFQRNFGNWSSGNNDIDKLIQNTQLLEHTSFRVEDAIEWIPYNRFCNIKYIAENKFCADWIDRCIDYRSNYNENWKRKNCNMFVILKSLNNPKNVTLELINKVL